MKKYLGNIPGKKVLELDDPLDIIELASASVIGGVAGGAVLDDKNGKEFFSNFSQYKINLYKTKRLAIVYSSFSNFLS